MYSGTQGASITYTVLDDSGNEGDWLLFSSPLRLDKNVVLRAKAIRYGYRESEVSEVEFIISPSGQ